MLACPWKMKKRKSWWMLLLFFKLLLHPPPAPISKPKFLFYQPIFICKTSGYVSKNIF
jgi:hypothetical protein